jgi:hypothetical protein
MKMTKNSLKRLIEMILLEADPVQTSPEEHFRAADDFEYADPRDQNRGRALQRDKSSNFDSLVNLDDDFFNAEDKEAFFLEKIKDIYDQLETLSRGV